VTDRNPLLSLGPFDGIDRVHVAFPEALQLGSAVCQHPALKLRSPWPHHVYFGVSTTEYVVLGLVLILGRLRLLLFLAPVKR